MNSFNCNTWIHLIAVRLKPEPWARSANRKGKARAHLVPQQGCPQLPQPLWYTRLPQPIGYTQLPRRLGYTQLPQLLGYTWLPRPVRVCLQGGWISNRINVSKFAGLLHIIIVLFCTLHPRCILNSVLFLNSVFFGSIPIICQDITGHCPWTLCVSDLLLTC